jgi:hypothetical protein
MKTMKKISAIMMALPFCMLSITLYAAQKDAPECKDHPLLPRLPGYFIAGCAEATANFDIEIQGKTPETIHVEGKSWAVSYSPQPELKSKPDRPQLLRSFENAIKNYGGTLIGMSNSIPIYKLADVGKEIWVAVLANNSGGGYTYRVIKKEDMVQTQKTEEQNDNPDCRKYLPPFFTAIPGYYICGCGEAESRNKDIKIVKENAPGTIHVEGKFTQLTYCPQDELKLKLSELQIRSNFENVIKQQGGTFIGKTVDGPKRDVYKLTRDGSEIWIEVWTENSGNYNYAVTRK